MPWLSLVPRKPQVRPCASLRSIRLFFSSSLDTFIVTIARAPKPQICSCALLRRLNVFILLSTLSLSLGVNAQTCVTTGGGVVNSVPVFKGRAPLGNAPIDISNVHAGIGTTSHAQAFAKSLKLQSGLVFWGGIRISHLSFPVRHSSTVFTRLYMVDIIQ